MSEIWQKHPLMAPPTVDEEIALLDNGPDAYDEVWNAYHDRIEAAECNPTIDGFRFPSWNLVVDQLNKWYEVFAMGGNGSSKSVLGSRLVVQCLLSNPGASIYCFAQDDDASTEIQQAYVYKALPLKFRDDHTTSKGGYLKYTPKNGFTDNSFFLDVGDGSEIRKCFFFKYSQYQSNKHKFEGYEYGTRKLTPFSWPEQTIYVDGKKYVIPALKNIKLNLGAWLDEYLENGELHETLLYRVPRRGASILSTFTAIEGMTPFVASKIKGTEITKKIKANPDLFDHSIDPKSGKSKEPTEIAWTAEKRNNPRPKAGVGVVYMPSEHNPYAGFDNMLALHRHKSLDERLVRFHGIPNELIKSLFPKFSTKVHVVSERWIYNPKEMTCYMVCDPAGRRSYSCLWAYVNRDGYVHIAKEFPEKNEYGPWAKFGAPRWTYDVGSSKVYMSVLSYVEAWRSIESELRCNPLVRIGDKRAFATENDSSIDRFQAFGELEMYFEPSGGKPQGERGEEEVGLQFLDEWFDYREDLPVDEVNRPILSIHQSCGNLIESILNYNADGIKDAALKDFIDLLRYLRMANDGEGPIHFGSVKLGMVRSTTGGY